jgi:hypothetical protein
MDEERSRKDGAGCLVLLGFIGLLPVLLLVWIYGAETLREARSVFGTIQLSGVTSIWSGLVQLIRYGSRGEGWSRLPLVFAVAYVVLLWQWTTLLCGWRTVVSERRLWAVSSGYFVSVILLAGYICYKASETTGSSIEDSPGSNRWTWLVATILVSLIPTCFLSITVPLWMMTPPAQSRRERPEP